jgi:transcriptional regulator with XRE-family HTH domain
VRRVLHRRIPVQPHHRFAHNLRQARLKKGISQQELGSRCELHRTEISLLERGGREPRLGTIVKLAGALDTSPGKLCAGIAWLPSTGRFQLSKPA